LYNARQFLLNYRKQLRGSCDISLEGVAPPSYYFQEPLIMGEWLNKIDAIHYPVKIEKLAVPDVTAVRLKSS